MREIRVALLGKAHQLKEQRYRFLSISVCSISVCPSSGVYIYIYMAVSVWVLNARTDVDVCVCPGARESELKIGSGRKIPCRIIRDSDPRQYCARIFSRTLYQQS